MRQKITLNNLINESNVYTKIYGGNYGRKINRANDLCSKMRYGSLFKFNY